MIGRPELEKVDIDSPGGIPGADGLPSLSVLIHNSIIHACLRIMGAVAEHGGFGFFENPPFKSETLVKNIQSKSTKSFLLYAEYLTIKCNVPERWLHTDLGCIFVRNIARAIKKAV